jgi:ATP-dependent DNA helicase RecQ
MNYELILKKYWGYDSFRGIQREIIESICSGHDTLGLMPTGGGKSITFQVPALAQEGVCIVITPLIALMKDQVMHLRRLGIRAAAIYSGLTRDEIIVTLENCIFGGIKILYVSPERLGSELFQVKLSHMKVSFITVDEAHCISQWGYDFRPSYLKIADIRKIKPDVPVLALTATATPQVVEDIQDKLQGSSTRTEGSSTRTEGSSRKTKFNVFRMSFERKNLAYIVQTSTDKYTDLVQLMENTTGSAIVYVRSRRRSKEIAELMNENCLNATFYHAGLDSTIKDIRQKDWQADRIRIMVATNAFGMGIDKPDVRLVVHFDCPDSLEAYFQEAGRAGRDGKPSKAILLFNNNDERKLQRRIADNYPEKEYIRKVYDHLAYFYQIGVGSGAGNTFAFDIEKFCHAFKHFPIQVNSALNILSNCGYINYTEETENKARVMFLIDRNDFYKLDNLTEIENELIVVLLRNYGGLFTDYNYIDESFIAQQIGLTLPQTYFVFKALNKRRILHFIPSQKTPYITYVQRREDGDRIIIPANVYEERKEQFTERVNQIILYAKNNNVCRSRQLLRYFGERCQTDCGICDVCTDQEPLLEDQKTAQQSILQLLQDHKKHHITELHSLNMERKALDEALEYLVNEEKIYVDGAYLIGNA